MPLWQADLLLTTADMKLLTVATWQGRLRPWQAVGNCEKGGLPLVNPQRSALFALMVLFAINVVNFYDRQVLGAVSEELRHSWQLSDSHLGLLNTAFTLLYAMVGIPLGRWADRGARVRLLALGVAVWSVLTSLSGFCQNFQQLFIVRLGIGVGEATCAPVATSLLGDLFPPQQRARAMSVFMMGLPCGMALSFLVSGWVVGNYGWRPAFWIAGLPGLVCALAVLWVAEPERGKADGRAADQAVPLAGFDVFRRLFAIPTLWCLIASGALQNFCLYAIGGFLVAYLRRFHGQDAWHANWYSTVGFALTGIPGLLVGGWLADWAVRRRDDGRLRWGAFLIFLAVPGWLVALQQPAGQVVPFTVAMGCACGLMYFYYSAVYPTLQDIVTPDLRGTAMALYFCAMYLLGASFGPWLVGMISDHFTIAAALAAGVTHHDAASLEPFRGPGLRSAMYVIPALLTLLVLVLWCASRTLPGDRQAVRQQLAGE